MVKNIIPVRGVRGWGAPPPAFKALGAIAPTYYPFSYPYLERKNQGLKKVHVMALFFITVNDFFWGGGRLCSNPPPAKYKADARGRDVHTFSNSFLFHFAFFPLFLLFLSFLFFFCFFGALGGAPGGTPPLLPPLVTAQGKRRKTSINCSFCPINHI